MVHIIKVYFENSKKEQEIRRLAVTSDVVSNFKQLLEKIQNVFQLPNAENFEIKWRDPENDFILMSSNDELAQALANAEDGLLRLYISLKNDKLEGTDIPKCNASRDFHPFVVCDGCDKKIVGVRYKCLQCRNYDLCSSCDAADKHLIHDMIKFVKPTYIPREWVFVGARKLWKSMFSRCPSNYFTYFEDENEQAPKAENSPPNAGNVFSQGPLNADSQAKDNTVPKSASSNSADNASSSSTSQQAKERSSPNPHGAQQNPLADFAKLPQVFMDCLQNDFVDAPKLIHEGLNQVLKAVQGTIEVVDHNIYKPEFRRGQENVNKTASSTSTAPTQITKSPTVEPSTSASNQVPEVISPHTTNENVDCVSDNDKSSASVVANEDEILVDTDNEKSPNAVEEPAACTEGWTLLDGGDANKMECNEANATERVVVYPDLMEVEVIQERNKDYIQTSDPAIISAVTTMQAMGFTNEGGWLERLLISKQGNINDALEALYPSIHH